MKTWIITPFFCKTKMLLDQIEHMDRKKLLTADMVRVVVDDHYPIRDDDLPKVFQKDCLYLTPGKNVGMQAAINYALEQIKPADDDVIILSDADDRASPGSYQALRDVVQNKYIAVAALSFKQIEENRKSIIMIPMTDRIKYWTHPSVDQWRIAAYRYSWIKSIGGFGQVYPFWGGLEAYLYPKFNGKKLVYLEDYNCEDEPVDLNDPTLVDPEYREYKNEIHHKQYKGSFAEWLKEK